MIATRRNRLGSIGVVALGLTLLTSSAASTVPARKIQGAPKIGTCVIKPDIVPVGDLTPGTLGTADTVVKDRTIVSFDVEVLGTLKDGIALGVDMVLVKVSGPVITATGGIAAGMSGSPVYVGGKLAGSISYGMVGADQTIGGMTPAQSMLDVLDYPEPAAAIKLTPKLRRIAAEATGEPLAAISGQMSAIRVPIAVSGLTPKQLAAFQSQMDAKGLPFTVFKGSSASTPTATPPTVLDPGSSFAAVASYGDVTVGAIGTTTAQCGNLTMAWGHPFFFSGETHLGMNAADIITVVTDPSSLYGPFKVGNVAEAAGTVDEDRLTGIRGIQGTLPAFAPVTSTITNPDLSKSRTGETDVVWGRILPDIAAFHLWSNITSVFDQDGPGTSSLAWTVNGTREDGSPFQLQFSNMYYSDFSVAEDSIWELADQLAQLQANDLEKVKIDSVDVQGSVTQHDLRAAIVGVESASRLTPMLRERRVLRVRAGGKVRLKVLLDPSEGKNFSVDLKYKLPKALKGKGPLLVSGGYQSFEDYGGYYYGYGTSPFQSDVLSFDDLLTALGSGTRANDIVVSVFPRKRGAADERKYQQDNIISGDAGFELVIVKGR